MSDTLTHVDETPQRIPDAERTGTGRLIGGYILRILLCLVFGLPLVFLFVSSLKPDVQIFGDVGTVKSFLPVGDISLDNYTAVFDRVPFWRFLMNSVVLSALTVILGIIVNSMCAFALARLKFRGKRVILGIILATLIVPFETLALPLLWWRTNSPTTTAASADWTPTRSSLSLSSRTPSPSTCSTSTSTRSRKNLTKRRRSTGRAGSPSTARSSCRCPGRQSRPSRS